MSKKVLSVLIAVVGIFVSIVVLLISFIVMCVVTEDYSGEMEVQEYSNENVRVVNVVPYMYLGDIDENITYRIYVRTESGMRQYMVLDGESVVEVETEQDYVRLNFDEVSLKVYNNGDKIDLTIHS